MIPLEGANCADLPGFVIDKYFDCNVQREPFLARTAMAICQHCVVLEECREEALTMSNLPHRGVLGGVKVADIIRARSWRSYELGFRDTPPLSTRPEWLGRTDAAETHEQALIEEDDDERG